MTTRLYYGWVIIFVMIAVQFAGSAATFPVLGLFLKPETAEQGWSRAAFALPLTIGTILGGFAGALTGPAMDKYGPRWIMGVAATLLGAFFFMMGFVQELWQHIVLGIAIRVVTAGAFFMVVSVVIPRWFVIKRGTAAAIAGLGGSLGQLANPIIVQTMIHYFGWRIAWDTMGAIVWLIALPPVIFLLKSKPEDMGLLPDGLKPGEAELLRTESNAKPGRRRSVEEVNFTSREAARTRAFYLMLISEAAIFLVISGLHFHWFTFMTSRGLAENVAVASISISFLAAIPASLLGGVLAERFPLRYILLVSYLGFALSVTLLLNTHTPLMAYAYGICLGVSTGIMSTVSLVIWADYYGRRHMGAIRGLISPVSQLTNACGPLVASLAYDAAGSYAIILAVFIGCSLAGSSLWLLATPPERKQPVLVPSASG